MVGMELFFGIPRQETRMLRCGTNHISLFFLGMGGCSGFLGLMGISHIISSNHYFSVLR